MINSLALGFRILGLRLDLLIIPVFLSLAALYWPPADISLLFADLQAIFAEAQDAALGQAPDADLSATDTPTPFAPEALLESLNASTLPLGQLLVNRTFLRVPGLVMTLPLERLLTDWSPSLSSVGDVLLVLAAFSAAGVVMGTLYQWQLARTVDATLRAWTERDTLDTDETVAPDPWDAFWFRARQTGLYLVLLVVLVTVLSFAVSLLMAALALVMPGAVFPLMGLYMLFLLMALPVFLFLQTYIIPGILLDSLKVVAAARQSVALIRNNVVSTLAFLLLSGFILFGIEEALGSINTSMNTGFNPVILLLSSMSFAYVGTGTALAFLVFYRSRCLMSDGVDIMAWFKSMELE